MNEEKILNMFIELKELMISNFEAINKKINKLEERMDRLEEKISKLEKRMDKLEERMNELEKKFGKHENEQGLYLAKLENIIYERTDALFDAYEVNQDSYKKFEDAINSIYNILDKYAYRIERLESKVN